MASPTEQALYLRRALAWADRGEQDKAMADVDHAAGLGDPLEAELVRGILRYRQGQLNAAQACFNAYLDKYPDHIGALQYRAQLRRDMKDDRGALQDYLQLLERQPTQDPGIYLAAAQLMSAHTDQGSSASLALLDTRMAAVGHIPQLQRYAIALETQQGNYEDALQRLATLDDAIRATPEWHLEAAELLLLNGDSKQAAGHLRVASEQLRQLRPTPARTKTREKIQALQTSMENDSR